MTLNILKPSGSGLRIAKPTSSKMVVSTRQYIPAVIGETWGGGYFAGYISHTANGVPTHALIVAPSAVGATGTGYPLTTELQLKTTQTATVGANSTFDGVANTAAMVAAGIADHPAAQFCVNLTISGFKEWYLPSRFELEIAYFNLKPSTTQNCINTGGILGTSNIYAVPRRDNNYTLTNPTQTTVTAFQAGGEQAFPTVTNTASWHWASTQTSSTEGLVSEMNGGGFGNVPSVAAKTLTNRVRAFRRIPL